MSHNLENLGSFFSIVAVTAFTMSSLCSMPWFHVPWKWRRACRMCGFDKQYIQYLI